MRSVRNLSLGVLAVLFLAATAWAQNARPLQKLSEHVYGYVGTTGASPSTNSFGANSGVVVGADGVLVVDTLISAKEAQKLLADIRQVSDKPVKYVVNTHSHLDHSWGNSVFTATGAVVIGQENSLLDMSKKEEELAHYQDYGLTASDMEGTALKLPTATFKEGKMIYLGGGVTVELSYPGPSHTKDSITVYVSPDRVLFTGDILFTKYHPYIGEGDLPSWEKILTSMEKTPAKIIVPGHGPLSTVEDIKAMNLYLKTFDQKAKELSKGKKQDDAPAIAQELLKALPEQGRTELAVMVESNLREKYLPH